MSVQYRLDLKAAGTGTKIAEIWDWLQLGFTRRCNDTGELVVQLGESAAGITFAENQQLEVWRSNPELGISWYKEAEYLVEDTTLAVAKSALKYTVAGRGYLSLCDRRIVKDYAGSSQSEKTGVAETVMKAIVTEQLGASAGTGRVLTGLTVQADGTHGNSVSKSFAYRNVLEVLKDLAGPGGVDFDIVGTGANTYEFRVYDGQRGTDRTATVLFALVWDNMGDPVWSVSNSLIRNAVLVGGQGEEDLRTVQWSLAAGITAWTRREVFVDARDRLDTAGLTSKGEAVLEENKLASVLSFQVLQMPSAAYGKDYFLGDLVHASFAGLDVDKKIQAVTIEVTRNSSETIKPELIDV